MTTQHAPGGPPHTVAPTGPPSPRMGWTALWVGVACALASGAHAAVMESERGPAWLRELVAGSPVLTEVTQDLGTVYLLAVWAALGFAAAVLGLMGAAQNRGRPQAIVGLVLGLVSPWVAAVAFGNQVMDGLSWM